jgi:methylenetetrahydrofolate reductase (NADPH)
LRRTEITKKKILVVSTAPELADIAGKAAGPDYEVLMASSSPEGLERARKDLPVVVLLGGVEPPASVGFLFRALREGWITRRESLLIVDFDSRLSVENLDKAGIHAENYLSLLNPSGNRLGAEVVISLLKARIEDLIGRRVNLFRESVVGPDRFCVAWEQVPGRGSVEISQERILENCRAAVRDSRIQALSVTDNPSGNPAIATDVLCAEIRKLGLEPLMHVALRDRNRTQCESLLYQAAALDIRNLLVITGDYPSDAAFDGKAKPVFDLDAVTGLKLVSAMNQGMKYEVQRKPAVLPAAEFFAGAAVSPFKQRESETIGQYLKLKKKIEAGAQFIITQVGFDARKLEEVLLWLRMNNPTTPVLASIYVLSRPAARAMHGGAVPGCVVTDKLMANIEKEAAAQDKGKTARLERAARMYAVCRGMGYKGVVVAGQGLTYDNVKFILDMGQDLVKNWPEMLPEFDYPQEKGFYFFEKDPASGLNASRTAARSERQSAPAIYLFSRVVHSLVFQPKGILFKMLRPMARFIDGSSALRRVLGFKEHVAKVILYNCLNCGDCALIDVGYLCPVSQCPKNQRNGPCGGSREGWCEVYPGEKKCIWVRAYGRLKGIRKEETIGDYIVPPVDWRLWQTSSWLNYYLGRDHTARRSGIAPVDLRLPDKSSTSES